MKRKKIVKAVWIVISVMVVLSMITWTIGIGFM